jgi:3-oxoacyl-ACP reductase-like protein
VGIFGAIMDKIFHHPAAQPQGQAAQPQAAAQPAPAAQAQPQAAQPAQAQPAQPAAAPAAQPVDVEAVLTQMAEAKGGGGNWRTSIVDLLKLLDLDSSLDARKQLAGELNVHVGADGTAEENIALQKAVMAKLAENGGKVPAGLS